MQIIHFLKNLDRRSGGPSVSVPGLCRALAEIPGMEIHLVTRDSKERVPREESDLFELHLVEGSRDSVRKIADSIRPSPADTVFHLHGLWDPMNHHAARYARSRRIPTVYSTRGMLEPWALRHKRLKKKLGWWLYQKRDLQRARLLHATAAREADSFARCGLEGIPSLVLPNGVALPDSLPNLSPQPGSAPRTLLFLGRIHPVKGLVPLLRAWAKSTPGGWRFQITGPDADGHEAELRQLIDNLAIGDSVSLTPPVDAAEKRTLLAAADLFVLPSFTENFGMAAAEALATGTPVAASTGTPWEFLESAKAGWSVPPEEGAWMRFLARLESISPDTLREMGAQGRRYAEKHFSWPAIAHRMAAAYRSLPDATA